jgi:hypothetical protein
MYSAVTKCNSVLLQQFVDNMANWASIWQLSINISKCIVLRNGSKRDAASINNMPLINTGLMAGVEANSDLSYRAHIVSI